ncbi:hypothetical protein AB894_00970 [Piscirickettsia salmonis]|nr:hypothetical protein AB894_00970 [Piscirickettsia salmonis]
MRSVTPTVGYKTEPKFKVEKGVVDFITYLQDMIKDLHKAGRKSSSLAQSIEKQILGSVYSSLNEISNEQALETAKLSNQVINLEKEVETGKLNEKELSTKVDKLSSELDNLKSRNEQLLEIANNSSSTTNTVIKTATFHTALERTAKISEGLTKVGEVMVGLQNIALPVSQSMASANEVIKTLNDTVKQSQKTIKDTDERKFKDVQSKITTVKDEIIKEVKDNNKSLATFAISNIDRRLNKLKGQYEGQRSLGRGQRKKLPIIKTKLSEINLIKKDLLKGEITGKEALAQVKKIVNDNSSNFTDEYNDGKKFKECFNDLRGIVDDAEENLSPDNTTLVDKINQKMKVVETEVQSLINENETKLDNLVESVSKSSESILSKLKSATEKAKVTEITANKLTRDMVGIQTISKNLHQEIQLKTGGHRLGQQRNLTYGTQSMVHQIPVQRQITHQEFESNLQSPVIMMNNTHNNVRQPQVTTQKVLEN